MTKKKLFMRFLREEGFRPKIDEDDDLVFMCACKKLSLQIQEN
jgi:hypothetical protein